MRRVKRPLKQSGDRPSKMAARVLAWRKGGETFYARRDTPGGFTLRPITFHVTTLAASVLSQDETKGPRKKVRK